jgi:hypothetical protein
MTNHKVSCGATTTIGTARARRVLQDQQKLRDEQNYLLFASFLDLFAREGPDLQNMAMAYTGKYSNFILAIKV